MKVLFLFPGWLDYVTHNICVAAPHSSFVLGDRFVVMPALLSAGWGRGMLMFSFCTVICIFCDPLLFLSFLSSSYIFYSFFFLSLDDSK